MSKKFILETELAKLETLVDVIENEETSIDDAVKKYAEAIKSASRISKKLEDYNNKIQLLHKDSQALITTDLE